MKTPTENWKASDMWSGFKEQYLPFVEWTLHPDDNYAFVQVIFKENDPKEYTNKWNRQQWKILVEQDGLEKTLSGGTRLFQALKRLMIASKKDLMDLGQIEIDRIGSGFECNYKANCITLKK